MKPVIDKSSWPIVVLRSTEIENPEVTLETIKDLFGELETMFDQHRNQFVLVVSVVVPLQQGTPEHKYVREWGTKMKKVFQSHKYNTEIVYDSFLARVFISTFSIISGWNMNAHKDLDSALASAAKQVERRAIA